MSSAAQASPDRIEEVEKIIELVAKDAEERDSHVDIRGAALAKVELEMRRQMLSSAGEKG